MHPKSERALGRVARSSPVLFALLIVCAAAASGCRLVEHMLTPKIPPGLNLVVGNEVWRRIPPINLSGTWIDSHGGHVTIDETGGYGSVSVQSDDTRFLWSAGVISILNGQVTLDRELAGQKVDTLTGRMSCVASKGQVAVSFDFGDAGTWSREGSPVPLAGEWYFGGKRIRLTTQPGSDEVTLEADPALGWSSGRGSIRQGEASLVLETPRQRPRQVVAELRVGTAWTMEDIQAAHAEAQRAGSSGH